MTRIIDSSLELRSLLQMQFVAELVHPGRELYLHLPELADAPLVDNEQNQFRGLIPDDGFRMLSLADVLSELLLSPIRVYLATQFNSGSERFVQRLRDRLNASTAVGEILVKSESSVMTAGVLGDDYCLSGQFALDAEAPLTRGTVEFTTDRDRVAAFRAQFAALWEEQDDVQRLS